MAAGEVMSASTPLALPVSLDSSWAAACRLPICPIEGGQGGADAPVLHQHHLLRLAARALIVLAPRCKEGPSSTYPALPHSQLIGRATVHFRAVWCMPLTGAKL